MQRLGRLWQPGIGPRASWRELPRPTKVSDYHCRAPDWSIPCANQDGGEAVVATGVNPTPAGPRVGAVLIGMAVATTAGSDWLLQVWGMTETSPICTVARPTPPPAQPTARSAERRAAWQSLALGDPLLVLVAVWGILVDPRLTQFWAALFPAMGRASRLRAWQCPGSARGPRTVRGRMGRAGVVCFQRAVQQHPGRRAALPRRSAPQDEGCLRPVGLVGQRRAVWCVPPAQPWSMFGSIGSGALLYALPAKRFRSRWVSIILHSGQTLFFTVGDPRAGPGAGLTHRTGSAPRWRSAGQHVSNRPGRRMCHEATAAALARWSCDAEGSLKTVVLAETLTAQPNRARR